MNTQSRLFSAVAVVVLTIASPAAAQTIVSRTADAGGVRIQYLTAGHGPAILLLHGYAETSRMWRPLIPKLVGQFTVIAPDLPGIGDSDVPADGLGRGGLPRRVPSGHAMPPDMCD